MFSRFFIYRPIFASVISIVIVLVGTLSIPLLPIESMPTITPPSVQVSARYPGAGASVVEEAVTAPLEEKINGVENMIYMSSKSASDGSCNITVTFEIGTDVDMATVLVQNRVKEAEPGLPEEVKRQGVSVKKQSTNLVLMVNLISPEGTYDELFVSNYVTTRIKDVLARTSGVSDVKIFGAKDFGMRDLAGSSEAAGPGSDHGRRAGGAPGAERPGGRRPDRLAAGAGGPALRIHRQHSRSTQPRWNSSNGWSSSAGPPVSW
jgi:HAE1 family hydrophobic/amphiphilic exporter-1